MLYETRRRGLRVNETFLTPLALFLILTVAVRMLPAEDGSREAASRRMGRQTQAENLVEESLRLRAEGATAESRDRLTQAVALVPDYAPARWQLGEIRRGKQWTSLEEFVHREASKADFAEYARQRDDMSRIAAPIWLKESLTTGGQSNALRYSQMTKTATRYLRKTLDVSGRPDWAQLQIQVIGICDVFVNGNSVLHADGSGLLGVKVITGQLHPGTNVVALSIHASNDQQVPGVRVWLEGVSHNHTIFTIPSDDSWKVATEKEDGWYDTKFDDRHWAAAIPAPSVKSGEVLAEEWSVSTKLEAALAHWCQEHELPEQSHFHWTRILHGQPQNKEAIKALGLQQYQGRLLTPSQVDEAKQDEREAIAAMSRWYPVLQKLQTELRRETSRSLEGSRKKLLEADATAIPAFEKVLKDSGAKEGDPAYVTEFVKSVLSRSDEPASTAKLSDIARNHPQESVRHVAIEALKGRDLLTFVPDLMGALESPKEVTTSVTSDDKSATCTARYFHAGILSDEERTVTTRFEPELKKRTLAEAVSRAKNEQRQIEAGVASWNLRIPERNDRIIKIIRAVSQTDQGETASAWWKWWGEHNELLIPTQNRVRQTTYFNTEILREERSRKEEKIKDCFAKGTLVWTQTGLRPIETIRIGDTVLAQDVEKGELALKVVLGTSIRPASPMTSVHVGDETIVSTRGHRYWLDGIGWRMAKSLRAGNLLHGVNQPLNIDEVSEAPEQPAWNLIVEGFHSYFVGRQAILVHDSGAPRPTTSIVPGLSR